MPPTPVRRLNLLDGMIVMAGVAACLLLTRLYLTEYAPRFIEAARDYDRYVSATSPLVWLPACWYVAEGCKFATLWLGFFTPIVLLIRLRPPRPRRRRMFVQPGTVAMMAVTLITGLGVMLWGAANTVTGWGPSLFFYTFAFTDYLAHAGSAVLVAWTTLILARRWRPEPSSIDRVGRFLGACWIVLFLVMALNDFVDYCLIELVPSTERWYLRHTPSEL